MLTKELILSKYPKYSNITEIKKLNIWGEDIEDISIISQMTNLEVLSLSANKISSLFPLSYCLNMREIILRNNNIYSFDELYHLKKLPKLKELWLEGNPITNDIFYVKKVLNILPKLHTLDNKNILLYKNKQKRGYSEEQVLIKNSCDYNANIAASNKKKILLRRVFSYFEPSSEGGGYIETSNDASIGQKKQKNDNYLLKRIDLSEFKIKFSTRMKSAKKGKKNFKKIKLKLKNNSRINTGINITNNFMMYNGPKISNRKLTVETNINIKPTKRENITVQNSITEFKEPTDFKNKKLTLLGNKDKDIPNILYRYKNDDKISININNYENDNKNNNNNNMMKVVYSLVDKMNIQELLNLKEVVDKKISFLIK